MPSNQVQPIRHDLNPNDRYRTSSVQPLRECDRCSARTKRGQRCKNRTCKTFPKCYQHLKSEDKLIVKNSTIPNAGLGLFAVDTIPKDSFVAYYTGDVLDDDLKQERYPGGQRRPFYVLKGRDNEWIDARSTATHVGRYINHKPFQNANTKFSFGPLQWNGQPQPWGKILASKNIKGTKNDPKELFVSYGRGYHLH